MSTHGHRSATSRFVGTRIGRLMLAGPLIGLMSVPALAGPEGEQVVHGSAQFSRNGLSTVIRTSNSAIINYTGFDLNRNESVRFIQPGANSRVLNRIQSGAPTFIDGSVTANGNVFFVNNAGIVFGQNAMINVGGLFAAAGNISNRDFIAGKNHFTNVSGEVVNNGTIEAGSVGLVGHRVANYGSIVAPEGLVTMASGDDVYIGERNGHVFARISASEENADGGGIVQAGSIVSRGANLSVGDHFALAVLDSSSIRAERLTVQGGRVGSEVTVAGEIDATRAGDTGGRVDVFGETVRLEGASIDASGDLGGGVIRIGGDYQGQGKSPTSQVTLVSGDVTLNADALLTGRGGRVIVWADGFTGFAGYISARGGALNGNGGFVEVSGKNTLAYRGLTDVRATNGHSGKLLLDPRIINIVDGDAGDWPLNAQDGSLNFDEDPAVVTITDAELANQLDLLGDGELLLQASTDIRIQDGVDVTVAADLDADGLLILEAGRRVRFLGNATFDLDNGSLRIIANSDAYTPSEMARLAGTGDINMSAGSSITTDGGTIELFLQDLEESGNIQISTIDAGDTGTVRVLHTGLQGASNHHIQQVAGGLGITAGTVELTASDSTGRIGLDAASRMILNADNLTATSAGGVIFLDQTGATIVNGLSSSGGNIDLLSSGTVELAGDVDAGAGTATIAATQITTTGGTISGSSVGLSASTGRLGDPDDRLDVTTDLLAASANTRIFLQTQALGGGSMVVGDFGGLSGITSATNTIELLHTGDLTVDADITAAGVGDSAIDTTGTLELLAGRRISTPGSLTTTALVYDINAGDGLSGDTALTVRAREGLDADTTFLAELETNGSLTIEAMDGDLTVGGQAAVFGVATDVTLMASDALQLQGADPTEYSFNDVSLIAGSGIEFTAGVTGLTSADGIVLDAGNGSIVNILQPGQFTITSGAGGTTLNSSVTAAGDLRFIGGVDAVAFDGLPSRGAPVLVFDVGGTLAFDNGLNAAGQLVEIIAANGTLGDVLSATRLSIFSGTVSVGNDNGGFWVSNAFLDLLDVGTLGIGALNREADQVFLDGIATTFDGDLTVNSSLIDAINNDSAVDNVQLTALDRILIDGVRLETTGAGRDLRLEAPNGIIMSNGATVAASGLGGAIDLHSDVTGVGDATFDGVLRVNGLGTRSISRDALDVGTIRFAQNADAAAGQGLLVDAADGMITFGSGVLGQAGAFGSVEMAAGGGIFADTSVAIISNGSVTLHNDLTALGRIDIVVDADSSDDGTDSGTFAGLNSNAGAGTARIAVTNGTGDLGNTLLTFNGLLRTDGVTNDGIALNAGTGTVAILGGVESNGGIFSSQALETTMASDIATAGGDATISDNLLVSGPRTATTGGGIFSVGGLTVLDDAFDLNTAGGTATFGGAIVGSAAGVGTFRADTGAGDIVFDGGVGRNGVDLHLDLFQITNANDAFFHGGLYEANTISLNAGMLRIDLPGGGTTEFVSRGGTMDFLGGGFSLAGDNNLMFTALDGGNVTLVDIFADVADNATVTARVRDDISLAGLGTNATGLLLVDVDARLANFKGLAFSDQFIIIGNEIDFTGGADSINGRDMTIANRDALRDINVGGDGTDATRLNITQGDIDAMADGFDVIRVGNAGTENVFVLGNPGDLPVLIRDPFEMRGNESVSVTGDVLGSDNAGLRLFSGAATLLNADITLNGGGLFVTNLVGGGGQVVIRETVRIDTAGGEVSILGPIDGDALETNSLFVDAGDGAVGLGRIGVGSAIDNLTVTGGTIAIDQIGNGTKAGVRVMTDLAADTTLTFLGGVYNTGEARYAAGTNMATDRNLLFITNDSDISFGAAAGGLGDIAFGAAVTSWTVRAGDGTVGLDGMYTGDDVNMRLTGSSIVLNGDTMFTNPDGLLEFNGLLVGHQRLEAAMAGGRVQFRQSVGDNGGAEQLGHMEINADRIEFFGSRVDADSAHFVANRYDITAESVPPIYTFSITEDDLDFSGGQLRFSSGQLNLNALQGSVSVAEVLAAPGATTLSIMSGGLATLNGIGAGNGSGVDELWIQANDMNFLGDMFVRDAAILRPLTEGRRISVGSPLNTGNANLEITQDMINRFASGLATSTLFIGGHAAANDLDSPLAIDGFFSGSRIDIRNISIDRQTSFFGSEIQVIGGNTLNMTDGAGVRLSSIGVSRLNGSVVSEGGVVVVNGERAILNGLIDSNGGDIFIRSENAFVDDGAVLSTRSGPRDGNFFVDGGVDGLVAGSGNFVLDVGRGNITLADGAGFGQARRLRSVDLTASRLELTNVLTTGDQTFEGTNLLRLAGGTLDSLDGDIRFENAVSVAGTQSVHVGNGTIFMGGAILGDAQTKDAERLTLGAMPGGHVEFQGNSSGIDALLVDADAMLFGDREFFGDEIRFLGSVDSGLGKVKLEIHADSIAQLGGDVGGLSPLRSVIVSAGNEIVLGSGGPGEQGIRIDTCGLQDYQGDTTIAGDVRLQVHGFDGVVTRQDSILFQGDVNGAQAGVDSLTAIVDRTHGKVEIGDTAPPRDVPIIAFAGNVGADQRLSELNLNFVSGEIDGRMNEGGAFGSGVATILFGDLDAFDESRVPGSFTVRADQLNVGRGEAMTAIGSLGLFGVDGRVSDVSTLHDMTLSFTSSLTIANRVRGNTFDPGTKRPTGDDGADLVSGGGIDIIGGGRFLINNDGLDDAGVISLAATGADVSFAVSGGLPTGLQLRSLPANSDALFIVDLNQYPEGASNELLLSDRFVALDVRAAGPSNTNVAEAIAGATQNADSGQVETGTTVEATIREVLRDLGLEPRGYAIDYVDYPAARAAVTETMLGSLDGSGLFVDVADLDNQGGVETTIERLDRGVTIRVVQQFLRLWKVKRDESGVLPPPSEEFAGNLVPYDTSEIQATTIQATFEQVTNDCLDWMESEGQDISNLIPADVWMEFLIARKDQYPAASVYVVEMERLIAGLREMGLSRDELRRVWEFSLRNAMPRGVDSEGLRQLLSGEMSLDSATTAQNNGREPVINLE